VPTRGDSFQFLEESGQSIFGNVGSMLYVGHRGDTHPWWHETFAKRVGADRLAVIDCDKGNLETARHVTSELYLGDIRGESFPRGFGLVFWDEGPEHLAREESLEVCKQLIERHVHLLVSCPWGYQKQGAGPHDPEFHHWGPEPADFESIGMTARAFGQQFPEGHGNLIAWI
jgi:hypothetical protein